MPIGAGLLDTLRDIVGDDHVLTDPGTTAGYCTDWTGRFTGSTPAVVRPGQTEEVAAVVAACGDHSIPIVPQGGNTGLVGGSVPGAGELVLSLRRLDRITATDPVGGQLTAGAGASIAAVHEAAKELGWAYGVDFSARDSATVGGSVATNAGGLRVLRYGDTRAQLLGIEAVMADGRVVRHLGGLVKDNTGYHLPSLLCGSEGTLAVVTAARLRLVPRAEHRVTALLAFDSVHDVLQATAALRRWLPELEAAEVVLSEGVDLVCTVESLPHPFATRHAAYLLVECAGQLDPTNAMADAVASLAAVADAAVASDAARRAELWRYREAHTEVINSIGPPHKLDVTLPTDALGPFVPLVQSCVERVAPHARVWLFGHAADGNLHVNITGLEVDDDTVDDAVLSLVAELGGSISAEHGIGVAKRRWLVLNRSTAELDAFHAIKSSLDPKGILNPNVLLP